MCTNGIISFGSGISSYTPTPFPIASNPVVAPFWGDVDTRSGASGSGIFYGYVYLIKYINSTTIEMSGFFRLMILNRASKEVQIKNGG